MLTQRKYFPTSSQRKESPRSNRASVRQWAQVPSKRKRRLPRPCGRERLGQDLESLTHVCLSDGQGWSNAEAVALETALADQETAPFRLFEDAIRQGLFRRAVSCRLVRHEL